MSTLFIVATPIGNLQDITLRALETLKDVDMIACEDTRRTERLLAHFGFRKPLFRYDEHTHERSSRQLISALQASRKVALVTDAGTPAVSDPGARLVQAVVQAGLPVVPIPGVSAVTAAVSASGWGGDGFLFLGFLPRKKGPAGRVLREGLGLGKTVVLFESPFRTAATLALLAESEHPLDVIVARELTKIHEEFLRGSIVQVQEQLQKRPEKGEVVILCRRSSA
jgi:16S rRNA (cytidine1402-2'-O)-methyltransferase